MPDSDIEKLEARIAELEKRFDALLESYEDLLNNPTRGSKVHPKLNEAKGNPGRRTL